MLMCFHVTQVNCELQGKGLMTNITHFHCRFITWGLWLCFNNFLHTVRFHGFCERRPWCMMFVFTFGMEQLITALRAFVITSWIKTMAVFGDPTRQALFLILRLNCCHLIRIYLFKVNKRNTKKNVWNLCNFKQSHQNDVIAVFLVSLSLTLNKF